MQYQHKTDIQLRISEALEKRVSNGRLRQLTILGCPIDFRSNDYLGLAKSAWIRKKLSQLPTLSLGATGSRLLSGNTVVHQKVENFLAEHYQADAALLFNSGYDANVGLISTVIRPEDAIYYDEAIHASMHQGIKLSGAQSFAFRHNNIDELKNLLQSHPNERIQWILCESYYSMDGDQAPLKELAQLSQQYNAHLIVDEAHGIGCFSTQGKGLCDLYEIQNDIFARVVTFGKAMGAHGAAVLCDKETKSYLVNFSKPLIYSTAMTPKEVKHIQFAHEFVQKFSFPQLQLKKNIQYFIDQCKDVKGLQGEGPIFSLIVPGEKTVRALANELQQKGLAIQPIVSPTVPIGAERLRIILHSFNTKEEIDILIHSIKNSSCFPQSLS